MPAVTVVGLALTVECEASTLGAWNVTVGSWLTVTVGVSVVSTAVSVTGSATVSVTINVVCPLESVTAGDGPMTFAVDDDGVKLTALPATGTAAPSSSVTVTVDRSTPSAVAAVGEATAVDTLADTVAATAGPVPSPGLIVPESVGSGLTKNAADHRWG